MGHAANYARYKKITISSTNVDANLTDVPVFVPVAGDMDIGTNVQSGSGHDIRFSSDPDGDTDIPYHRLGWQVLAGSADSAFFVKRSLLAASNVDIYIWYDKASDTDGDDPDNTYDSNFIGYYNQQDENGNDDTINANNLTPSGIDSGNVKDGPVSPTSIIKAIEYNGTDERMELTSANFPAPGSAHSVEVIWKHDNDGVIVSHGGNDAFNDHGVEIFENTDTGGDTVGKEVENATSRFVNADNANSDLGWNYACLRLHSSTDRRITNYSQTNDILHANTNSGSVTPSLIGNPRLSIGRNLGDTDHFDGQCALVTISDVARSDAFAKFRGFNLLDSGGGHELTWGSEVSSPRLSSTSPADDATDVAVDANLEATFNQNVQARSGNILIKRTADDSTFATIDVTGGQVSFAGAVMTINPTSDLENGTEYYLEWADGVIESTSDSVAVPALSDSTEWSFTTVAASGGGSRQSVRRRVRRRRRNGDSA